MKCTSCGEEPEELTVYFGNATICKTCISTKSVKEKSPPPIFSRWTCVTHKCGSYNFNAIMRHTIYGEGANDCDIYREETIGIIKPKTFGGVNGDIGKQHFTDKSFDRILVGYRRWIKQKRVSGEYRRRK